MKALVTGANGLLGGNLCRELLARGHSVRALTREGSDQRTLDGLDVENVHGDVRDAKALEDAANGCDVLFHTAAVFSYWGYSKDEMYATAAEGAKNAVDAAKAAGIERMVLTSTSAILGSNDEAKAKDETANPELKDVPDYFISKDVQEKSAFERGREVGLDVVAANPSVILGPYDFRPSASLPLLLGYINAPVTLTYPGGSNVVHARDVARAHLLLAEKGQPFERYVVSAENTTWEELHTLMSEVAGLPPPRFKTGSKAAWVGGLFMELGAKVTGKPPLSTRELAGQVGKYFWYDHSKIDKLGFEPRGPRETLAETLAWVLDSDHLTDKQKKKLKPSEEVIAAGTKLRS